MKKEYVPKSVDNIFSNLHSASTVSSRARTVKQPTALTGVSFAKPKKVVTSQYEVSEDESRTVPSFYSHETEYTNDDFSVQTRDDVIHRRTKSASGSVGYKPKASCMIKYLLRNVLFVLILFLL